jgi:RNA polymerase sigma factor (sigma-70 family)
LSSHATGAMRLTWTASRPATQPATQDEPDDAALARRAAAGDGAAFATLYDRHERRTYNFCYRITGSPEDAADATQETFAAVLERLPRLDGRELRFGPYLMTAARNASYDTIARRKRALPAGDIPDSAVPLGGGGDDPDGPERRALREAHQEQIRAANESLPPRQREALALRELEELSYDEVAEVMGMNRNSVAQLISRARINLREGLRQTALGSVAAASPQCERALPLLAMRQDEVLEGESAAWLAEHLVGCGTCRVRLDAMEEAAVAYRMWVPLVPALWLRGESIARAAERVGADWSACAASPRPRGRHLRIVATGGLALVVAFALAVVDLAQSPTRAPAAPERTVEATEVAVAPAERVGKPVQRRARKRRARPEARARAVVAAPEVPAGPAPVAVIDSLPEHAPAGSERRRRSQDGDRRVKPPVAVDPGVADPPPDPVAEDPTPTPEPPPPLCPGPNCPGGGAVTTKPPCGTSIACPPPRAPRTPAGTTQDLRSPGGAPGPERSASRGTS